MSLTSEMRYNNDKSDPERIKNLASLQLQVTLTVVSYYHLLNYTTITDSKIKCYARCAARYN